MPRTNPEALPKVESLPEGTEVPIALPGRSTFHVMPYTKFKDELKEDILPEADYKVYVARIIQVGTNAPVATVFKNTLSGTPIWTRDVAGEYTLTLAGEFTTDKVWLVGSNENQSRVVTLYWNDEDTVRIFSAATLNGTPTDSNVSFHIEIRVYN